MSVHISSQVWTLDMQSGKKLVLLALADMANDEGICWPSIQSLCKRTGLSERAIQLHLRELQAAGLLGREERYKQSTIYHLTIAADSGAQILRAKKTTALGRRKQQVWGAEKCISDPQNLHPETSIETSIEPSVEPSVETSTRGRARELPAWVPAEAWAAFLEMRKKLRAPMTAASIDRTVAQLEKLKADGHDPAEVLMQSVQNAWRGVFPTRSPRAGKQSVEDINAKALEEFKRRRQAAERTIDA